MKTRLAPRESQFRGRSRGPGGDPIFEALAHVSSPLVVCTRRQLVPDAASGPRPKMLWRTRRHQPNDQVRDVAGRPRRLGRRTAP